MQRKGCSTVLTGAFLLTHLCSCSPPPCLHLRAIELANSIEETEPLQPLPRIDHTPQFQLELSQYYYGLSLHQLGEFRRAAHVLCACQSPEAFFLRCYSLYLVRPPLPPSIALGLPPPPPSSSFTTKHAHMHISVHTREISILLVWFTLN